MGRRFFHRNKAATHNAHFTRTVPEPLSLLKPEQLLKKQLTKKQLNVSHYSVTSCCNSIFKKGIAENALNKKETGLLRKQAIHTFESGKNACFSSLYLKSAIYLPFL